MHGVVNLTVRISKQTKITRVGMENEIWGLFHVFRNTESFQFLLHFIGLDDEYTNNIIF